MNKRFLGVLIFAFVVATVGGVITYRAMISRSQNVRPPAPTVKIVLATRDLELGRVLREDDVTLADWPGAVPAGATARVPELVGRGVTTAIYAKEPIIESRLAPKGAGGGLAAMIPPGMRAVAVRVNEVVGVAGFVVPGMRVDVLISGNTPGATGNLGMLTRTLLQNLEVLSAGQDIKKDAEGKPMPVQVINLLVTPEQAEQLSLASSQTVIQLVLRNPLDRQVAKTPGTAIALLFRGGGKLSLPDPEGAAAATRARPRAAAPPKKTFEFTPPRKEAPFVMEIISGTKKVETKFNSGGEGK
jgi:pilus assembly protein CpaB